MTLMEILRQIQRIGKSLKKKLMIIGQNPKTLPIYISIF